ncbi:hypothetical protein FB451DRAFT_1352020 [Mycena latifolia]|nr:hypothetical protein FB451DRAFT_1352020 [Mycena latifolia]
MLSHSSSRAICKHLCQVSIESARPSVSSPCLRRVLCRNMSTSDDLHRRNSSDPSGSGPTWDHVFSSIKEMPPQIPHSHSHPGVGPRRPRRQTMTAQEINAFNEIFNLIFDSISEKGSGRSSPVDISGAGMGDLFGTLRRHSKKMKWTAQSDEDLDRKKDEMDRCESDQQLLDWAMHEVFGESQLYAQEVATALQAENPELPMLLQPPTYPHLISLLIRTFRDKYRDPHLALSIFDYARHLSIASYVFGCSTSAYNELIETRWNCFRDLKGVHDALEEMTVNGVDMDHKTRELVEKVRQEVGERHLWAEENGIGGGGVWEMLNDIEKLANRMVVSRPKKSTQKNSALWNGWRAGDMPNNEFNKW